MTSNRSAFARRVHQGVVDTVLEYLLFTDDPARSNAAAFHLADLRAGREWQVIAPDDLPRLASINLPGDARVRIEADLRNGYLVLMPTEIRAGRGDSRLGWWRMDPADGRTLGMLPDGGGASMSEYAHKVHDIMHKAGCAYSALGLFIGHAENALVGTGLALCIAGGLVPGAKQGADAVKGGIGVGGAVKGGIGVVGMAVHILEVLGSH